MRINRLVAGLVTAGLVGLAPLAVTAPANAATLGSATTLSIDPASGGAFDIGDNLYFTASVKGADGNSPNSTGGGTASLQISTPSVPTFTTIAVDTTPSSVYFPDVTATTNATYKVVYSGGVSGFGSTTNTLTASESLPVGIGVQRNLKLKTKRLKVIGKVTPDYSKQKVKVLRKAGKKFKKFASVKTNKKGQFVFNAPRKNKFSFILVIKGDANYVASPSTVYTVRIY